MSSLARLPFLVVATIDYGPVFLLSMVLVPFADFLWDDPNSGGMSLVALTIVWISLPVSLLTALVGMRVARAVRWPALAGGFVAFPFIHVGLLALLILAVASDL